MVPVFIGPAVFLQRPGGLLLITVHDLEADAFLQRQVGVVVLFGDGAGFLLDRHFLEPLKRVHVVLEDDFAAQRDILRRQAFHRHVVVGIKNGAIQSLLPRLVEEHAGQHFAHVRFLAEARRQVADADAGFQIGMNRFDARQAVQRLLAEVHALDRFTADGIGIDVDQNLIGRHAVFLSGLFDNLRRQVVFFIGGHGGTLRSVDQRDVNRVMLPAHGEHRVELADAGLIFLQADGVDDGPSRIGLQSFRQGFHRKRVDAHRAFEVAGHAVNHLRQNLFGLDDVAVHAHVDDFHPQIVDLRMRHLFQDFHLHAVFGFDRVAHFFTAAHVEHLADADQSFGTVERHRLLGSGDVNFRIGFPLEGFGVAEFFVQDADMIRPRAATTADDGHAVLLHERFHDFAHLFRLQLVTGLAVFRHRLTGVGHDRYGMFAETAEVFHRGCHLRRADGAVDAEHADAHARDGGIRGVDVGIEDLHFGKLVDRHLRDDRQALALLFERAVGADDRSLEFQEVLLGFEQQHIRPAVDQALHLHPVVVHHHVERGLLQIRLGARQHVVGRADGPGDEQGASVVFRQALVMLDRLARQAAAFDVQMMSDGFQMAAHQRQPVGNGVHVGGVDLRPVEILEAQGGCAEGVGLDNVRARLQVLEMDVLQLLRPREHQQIGQHAEQRPAEGGVGHVQRLHHGAHGTVQDQNLVFQSVFKSHRSSIRLPPAQTALAKLLPIKSMSYRYGRSGWECFPLSVVSII